MIMSAKEKLERRAVVAIEFRLILSSGAVAKRLSGKRRRSGGGAADSMAEAN